jgi:MFS family permease
MLAYALMLSGTSLMVLIAGIIGINFAPSEGLATLPIACVVVGVACSTLPTGRLLTRWGRRRVFIAYGMLSVGSALFAAFSLVIWSFASFCMAAFVMGWAGAAVHQYRFAALEQVPPRMAAKATSVLLLGGIIGAFIGPEIAVRGKELLQTSFAGSYLLLAVAYFLGVLLVSANQDSVVHEEDHHLPGRPLAEIIRSPVVVLAVSAAALGYGVMSFLMPAAPISMHQHAGHSLELTKQVIQAHILAMYLPSLVFAWMLARFGFRTLLAAGVAAFSVCIVVALSGINVWNYWVALAALGVGWNWLFLSGTNLLVYGYRSSERFRVQAMNDFLVFTVQAVVSLSAGWVLFQFHWRGMLLGVVPLILVFSLLLWRSSAFVLIREKQVIDEPVFQEQA